MGDPQIGVGSLPDRVQPALWVCRDGEVRVLAWFVSREAMAEFLSWGVMCAKTPKVVAS